MIPSCEETALLYGEMISSYGEMPPASLKTRDFDAKTG
jgi:hypothetical protein